MKLQILIIAIFAYVMNLSSQELDLKEVIKRALENSKELKEIDLNIDKARLKLSKASGLLKPSVEMKILAAPIWETTGSIDNYKSDYSKWGIFAHGEISVVKPLYMWNMQKNYTRAAQRGLAVAKIESIDEKNRVLKRLIEYYYNAKLSNKLMDLADSNSKQFDKVENYLTNNGKSKDLIKFKIKKQVIQDKIDEASLARDLTQKAVSFYINAPVLSENLMKQNLSLLSFESEDLNHFKDMAKKNNFSTQKLEEGLIAKKELLKAEKKKKYPVFFTALKGSYGFSNVKEKQDNPWIYDPYNTETIGAVVGMKMDLNFNNISAGEEDALIEHKKLSLKKGYFEKALMLQVEKSFKEFMHNKALVISAKNSMKLAKKLFVKEGLTYNLRKNNAEDLLEALLGRVLAIKNYYTAISNCNIKYIELLHLCGRDLSDLNLYN
jgi:outer membrane protein